MKRYIEDDNGCMHVLKMTGEVKPCMTCSLATECDTIHGILCEYDGFHKSPLPEHYEKVDKECV